MILRCTTKRDLTRTDSELDATDDLRAGRRRISPRGGPYGSLTGIGPFSEMVHVTH